MRTNWPLETSSRTRVGSFKRDWRLKIFFCFCWFCLGRMSTWLAVHLTLPAFLVFVDLAGHRLGLLFTLYPLLDGPCCRFNYLNITVSIIQICFRLVPVQLCCLGAPLFSVGCVAILNAQTQLLALFSFFRPCPLSLTYIWHPNCIDLQDFIGPQFKLQWRVH